VWGRFFPENFNKRTLPWISIATSHCPSRDCRMFWYDVSCSDLCGKEVCGCGTGKEEGGKSYKA